MLTKILLSDGSGLTSRQLATILAHKGFEVHVLCPPGLPLTRWTRWVTKAHTVVPFGSSPYEWLRMATEVSKRYNIDILVPSQEQVSILSAEAESLKALGLGLVVPSFDALRRVLDKISAYRTLQEAALRQPESVAVGSSDALLSCTSFLPGFVKTPIGTASKGVAFARTTEDLARITQDFEARGVFRDGGQILVQRAVTGPLVMVQSMFFRGKLLSWHACLRAREGLSGGAANKTSLPMPCIMDDLVRLGAFLKWDGALSMDAILVDSAPYYIDVNPRIVEPMNALYSGVDLVDSMLRIAASTRKGQVGSDSEETFAIQAPGREGVRTHQFIIAALRAAESGRIVLLKEVINAVLGRHEYVNSREELTPVRGDLLSLIFLVFGTILLFIGGKRLVKVLDRATVSNYALTSRGWQSILQSEDEKTNKGKLSNI